MSFPVIIAAIVTHRRPAELRRLLESLAAQSLPLRGCVISDHAPDGTTHGLAAACPFETVVLDDPSNPGPGAGWTRAAEQALEHFPKADAIWYLDDDVVLPAGALEALWNEMGRVHADAIAPLLEDDRGKLWAFPEPEPIALRRTIRSAATPADALRLLGEAPIRFCWCTGACFLVRKNVFSVTGFHRQDFWMLGEDLEFSMRVTAGAKAVFTCRLSVPHLPPPAASSQEAVRSDRLKFCSLLQNLSYLSFHAPHSGPMKKYLAGNFRRFLQTHGFHWGTMRDAAACLWNGAVRARPAGTASGAALRHRILKK